MASAPAPVLTSDWPTPEYEALKAEVSKLKADLLPAKVKTGTHDPEKALLPPPEQRLVSATDDAEIAEQQGDLAEAITLRQTCLALTRMCCADDAFQLARASSDLAALYLRVGAVDSAVEHGKLAEELLLDDKHNDKRKRASGLVEPLLACVLQTIACGLAAQPRHAKEALDYFPRALAQVRTSPMHLPVQLPCISPVHLPMHHPGTSARPLRFAQAERVHGKRHLSTAPMLRSFARLAAPPGSGRADYNRAEALLDREMSLWKAHRDHDLHSISAASTYDGGHFFV